ncbi:GDA1/CD39 (nucleoside phosphatase) family protein, partial [Candidatus Regiella insecticola 5.15]
FFAISGLYQTLNFFGVKDEDKTGLTNKIKDLCKKDYPDIVIYSENRDRYNTFNKCANAVFANALLFNVLNLPSSHIKAVKKINNTNIRWTLGYGILSQNI